MRTLSFVSSLSLISSVGHAAGLWETKTEKSQLGANCQAKREYIQIRGAKPGSPSDQINAQIRREMTAGKQLRVDDCPERSSSEYFEYQNRATATSQREGRIGVDYYVRYATGRIARWCAIYDVKTGHELNLRRCLKQPETAAAVSAKACAQFPAGTPSHDYFCGGGVTIVTYCWDDKGVKALSPRGGDWRSREIAEVVLHGPEVKALMIPGCEF